MLPARLTKRIPHKAYHSQKFQICWQLKFFYSIFKRILPPNTMNPVCGACPFSQHSFLSTSNQQLATSNQQLATILQLQHIFWTRVNKYTNSQMCSVSRANNRLRDWQQVVRVESTRMAAPSLGPVVILRASQRGLRSATLGRSSLRQSE